MPMRRQSPGLKDVAAHAGVSIATVSRVINDAPYIRASLRARVLDSMYALGYQPHALAQSLRTGRTQTIGYVIYDISNVLFSVIALGIDDQLQEAGYTMLLTNSRGDSQQDVRLIQLMEQRRVDGLILALSNELHEETRNTLLNLSSPLVLLDREIAGVPADHVLTDHSQGIAQAVEHLHALGHRRIALLTGTQSIRPGRTVRAAFEGEMERLGLPIVSELMRVEARTEADVYGALEELLALAQPPTAVLAGSIQATFGTLRYVRERGIRVPEQLSVICYEDTEVARLMHPPYTVLARDIYQIGRQAAQMVLNRLEHPDAETQTTLMPMRLIVRGSTATPPTSSSSKEKL